MNVALISTLLALGGFGLAYAFYAKEWISAENWKNTLKPIHTLLINKFYIDDLYDRFIVQTVQQSISTFSNLFERYIIIGFAVNGTVWVTERTGRVLRLLQTGVIQNYVMFLMIGFTLVIYGFTAFRPEVFIK